MTKLELKQLIKEALGELNEETNQRKVISITKFMKNNKYSDVEVETSTDKRVHVISAVYNYPKQTKNLEADVMIKIPFGDTRYGEDPRNVEVFIKSIEDKKVGESISKTIPFTELSALLKDPLNRLWVDRVVEEVMQSLKGDFKDYGYISKDRNKSDYDSIVIFRHSNNNVMVIDHKPDNSYVLRVRDGGKYNEIGKGSLQNIKAAIRNLIK